MIFDVSVNEVTFNLFTIKLIHSLRKVFVSICIFVHLKEFIGISVFLFVVDFSVFWHAFLIFWMYWFLNDRTYSSLIQNAFMKYVLGTGDYSLKYYKRFKNGKTPHYLPCVFFIFFSSTCKKNIRLNQIFRLNLKAQRST